MGGLAGVRGLRLGAWGSGGLVRGRGLQGECLGGLGGSGGLGGFGGLMGLGALGPVCNTVPYVLTKKQPLWSQVV